MAQTFNGRTLETEKGHWTIFPGLCKGCGLCIQKCPKKCMSWSDVLGVYGTPSVEINDECIACGICQNFCPDCAIAVEKKKEEKEKH
ncbi:2-oxoglutarate ferredoxin oxidoreductase subunit delta [Desulfotomaculum arcticum]|uniref:2-oxoglutarate ferredoxin oxidoreductase subunit delta n=1 Tax=Desulfotruncus arcticus DSM 17038 TaxID=1121424 RepID=A0A1I2WBM5_9FIRM|nr:4Fe-4S binding protein [Desulfotruncus arcticus]SFG98818.1 2-oxoglutarate ferredoxin oxidoreductase subunit delta [Desulfotomaculum arcticum] [Desulfotruncus arcticus DSM 17038]